MSEQFEIESSGYGMQDVKIMHIRRDGPIHTIQEYKVGTALTLSTKKDYYEGINEDIVGTDAQKNITYLMAKKYGVEGLEQFAQLLANNYIERYEQVDLARIHIEEYPWQRIQHSQSDSKPHNHAFVYTPTSVHYCEVERRRQDTKPTIVTGIKGLRMLKTTRAQFVKFHDDEFRSTPDMYDRVFCTVADCSWEYSDLAGANFDKDWQTVEDIILQKFAGHPEEGILAKCMQNTLYITGKAVLEALPSVASVSIVMPNKHYVNFDTKPFQSFVPGDNNEVFYATNKPYSKVFAKVHRKDL